MSELLPLGIGTGIFGALFIFMPCFVKKGPYQGIIRCSMLLTVFSMWIFWATVYISQMKPLVGPRHKNSTLLFWRYKASVHECLKYLEIKNYALSGFAPHISAERRTLPSIGLPQRVPKPCPAPSRGLLTTPKITMGDSQEGAITIEEKVGATTTTEVPPHKVPRKRAERAYLRERLDYCRDQPDNMFECCNIPWLPRHARERCIQEPIKVFKLTCAEARCAFQEANWFVRPGVVNLMLLNEYYDSLVQDDLEWSDAVRLIKEQCLQINPKFQSVFTNCIEFDIMYCAMIRMLKHGPLYSWSTAAACAATKQFTAMCPICPEECTARDLGQYPETVCRACVTA